MKTVKDIFNIDSDIEVKDIKINSKAVKSKDIFVCVSGVNFDRHEFIDEAVNNGASVIVVSKDIKRDDVLVIKVDDCDEEMPKIARKLYDYHEGDFKLFGVTGTDGKTSTAMILSTLIGNDICGYIGTNFWNKGRTQEIKERVLHLENTDDENDKTKVTKAEVKARVANQQQ